MNKPIFLGADSCLNINVSCVKNYYSKYPQNVNLLTWLTSDKYKNNIKQLRGTTDPALRKKLKAELPAITPSGIFSRVDEHHLTKHTGFIQFDIDYKDNKHIRNYRYLHTQLKQIRNIAYCGLSAGGQGWWGLVGAGAHWLPAPPCRTF